MVPLSSSNKYCLGYGNPGNTGDGYILGFVIGVGKSEIIKSEFGSTNLDEINAFDKAEVEDTLIGQINMITVSSFCGPLGKIWGYDLARCENLYQNHPDCEMENVYSLRPLMDATKSLFGTVDEPRFPLMPGAHVPCASKNISGPGPTYLYSSLSIGIAEDRESNACLLMEDIGEVKDDTPESRKSLLKKAVESVLRVGENQHVNYKEIFTDLKIIKVEQGEVGCALVAAPYFTLAKGAVPREKQLLEQMSLNEWEKNIYKYNGKIC